MAKQKNEKPEQKQAIPEPKVEPKPIVQGCEIRIKDGVRSFIGGLGIGVILDGRKLYARYVGSNGIVTVSYAPDAGEIGSLLPGDVEFVADPKLQSEATQSEPSELIDIRIMGVPERIDTIRKLQKELCIDDDRVFLDENHEGLLQNAEKAWRFPTEKPFVMVIQDDIEVCNDFIKYAEMAAQNFPDCILTFFPFCFRDVLSVYRTNAIYKLPSPYLYTTDVGGQATLMKAEYVEPCLDAWDESLKGDDVNINKWAKENDIKVVTTLPAMVQHLGVKSVFDPGRSIGSTPYFQKDVSDFAWDNAVITDQKKIYSYQ